MRVCMHVCTLCICGGSGAILPRSLSNRSGVVYVGAAQSSPGRRTAAESTSSSITYLTQWKSKLQGSLSRDTVYIKSARYNACMRSGMNTKGLRIRSSRGG